MKQLRSLLPGLLILLLIGMNSFAQNSGYGSISGTVMSEADSIPVLKAKVFAFKFQNMKMPKQFYAETDTNGKYLIDKLPAGQYRVYVQVDSFVAEFYKDTNNPALAIPVNVGSGAAVTGVDFYLKLGGTISGVVTDSNGVAIPNVFISATPYTMFQPTTWQDSLLVWGADVTDENGRYQISTLDSGAYRIMARIIVDKSPFFQIKYYDDKTNMFEADPVIVDNGQQVTGIDFQFNFGLPTGGIAGTITDATGNPLPGIYVCAWQLADKDTFVGYFRGFRNFTTTDANGNYEIKMLKPGQYIVSATRMEWWNFQTLYYDGVSKYADATPVSVADAIVPNIDFVFNPIAELGSIAGTVKYDGDGAPVPNAFVEAMWVGAAMGAGHKAYRPSLFAWTDANGDYKIDQLHEGKYVVLVHKNGYTEFYDNTQDFSQVTEVEVKAGSATPGIDFGIPAAPDTGSTVSGVVTNDSTGAPIEGAIVTLFPVRTRPYGSAFKGKFTLFDFYATVSDPNGEYLIAGIPAGKYVAVCWAPKYLVEFYNDKLTPWSADPIELDGSSDRTGIDFALTPGWRFKHQATDPNLALGVISGQVVDNEGRYVADAYVSVLDQNYQICASEKTGADGSYTLAEIPAGQYFIKVDRMPYSTAYYGNTTELSNATPVSVGDDGNFSVASIDVQMTPMSTTSVEDQTDITIVPAQFELLQNYPNPFNPTTTIRYALPSASQVTLRIYNLNGEVVKTLVNGYQTAQYHQVVWNGDNEAGQKVAAGIYLYQLQAGDYQQTMRLILMK